MGLLTRMRETRVGSFRQSPFRKKGFLERVLGENPAIVLDTSAVIDLEESSRTIGSFFDELDESQKIFIPNGVFRECHLHNLMLINEYTKEISDSTLQEIGVLYDSSRNLYQAIEKSFGDISLYIAHGIANQIEEKNGDISSTDREVVGRTLQLASLRDCEYWQGFEPSHVIVLTSDRDIEDMLIKAKRDYNFKGISSISTKR